MWFSTKYFTEGFFNFLLNKGYFSTLYQIPNDLNLVNTWLSNYYEFKSEGYGEVLHYAAPLEELVLLRIDSLLSNHPSAAKINNNLVRLLLIDYYIENELPGRVEVFYKKLRPEKFIENLKEGFTTQDSYFYLMNRVAAYLASEERIEEAIQIAQVFPHRANRIKTYAMAARGLLATKGAQQEKAYILLDSALCEMNRIRDFEFAFSQISGYGDPRNALALALSSVGGQEMHDLAGKYVEQISMARQINVIERWMEGTAASAQYYLAYASIPEIAVTADRLNYFNIILLQDVVKRPMDKDWRRTLMKRRDDYTWQDIYYEYDVF